MHHEEIATTWQTTASQPTHRDELVQNLTPWLFSLIFIPIVDSKRILAWSRFVMMSIMIHIKTSLFSGYMDGAVTDDYCFGLHAKWELKASTSAFVIQKAARETMSNSTSHVRLYMGEGIAGNWDMDMLGARQRSLSWLTRQLPHKCHLTTWNCRKTNRKEKNCIDNRGRHESKIETTLQPLTVMPLPWMQSSKNDWRNTPPRGQ